MKRAKAEVLEAQNKIIVTLPHSEILHVWVDLENNVDGENIKIYDHDNGIFTKALTLDEQNAVITEALQNIRKRASEECDILQLAKKNAAIFYKNFLKSLGYEVSVIFTDDTALNVPSDAKIDHMKNGVVVIFRAAYKTLLTEAIFIMLRKIYAALILLLMFCSVSAFALSDSEYRTMMKNSVFARSDWELNKVLEESQQIIIRFST